MSGQDDLGAADLCFVTPEGEEVTTTVADVDVDRLATAGPVRGFPSYAGMRHYPGLLWTVTTRDLVGYESLLERDRVWLADFDPEVTAIASQPFWIRGSDGGTVRRHVPDYLLRHRDGAVTVVDVKPERLCERAEVSEVLSWTGRVAASRGWRYEVFPGAPATLIDNIRFLAAGRRWEYLDGDILSALAAAARPGDTLQAVETRLARARGSDVRAAVLGMLWYRVWEIDLDRPLSGSSVISGMRQVRDG